MNPLHKNILRYIIFGFVLLSSYLGIQAMYLDLNNPGSLEARQLNEYVNYLFIATVICSIPLLIEKLKSFEAWKEKLNKADPLEQQAIMMAIVKPMLKKIGFVIVLAIVVAFILQSYWGISPEIVQQYKDYYNPNPEPIVFP